MFYIAYPSSQSSINKNLQMYVMNATKLPLNSLKVLVLHLLHLQICLHTMLVYPQLLFGIPTWISTPILTEGSTGADVLGT